MQICTLKMIRNSFTDGRNICEVGRGYSLIIAIPMNTSTLLAEEATVVTHYKLGITAIIYIAVYAE